METKVAAPLTPNSTGVITCTPEELKRLIDEGVKAASQDQGIEVQGIKFDYEAMGTAIGNAITKSGRRKVTIGEYVEKHYKNRPKLRRKTFQHDIMVQPFGLSDNEINLLNQITHGGRYYDRKVEVIVMQDGAEDSNEDVVYLRWNNRTIEHKLDMKNYFKNFEQCLEGIVAEQKKEDAAADLAHPASAENRRHFGDRKVTREARAAAGLY